MLAADVLPCCAALERRSELVDRLSLGRTVMNGKAGAAESTAQPTILEKQLAVVVDQVRATNAVNMIKVDPGF